LARDPHRDQPILVSGAPFAAAAGALILVHGRGGTAVEMQELARALERPQFACFSPAAADRAWYPFSFLEPVKRNEPHLSSGLRLLRSALDKAIAAGVPAARVVWFGFSQGACLLLEFAVRNPARYGGIIGLSGGLFGPAGTQRDAAGSFDATPVFLGAGDRDPHVPKRRVDETATVMEQLGARVTKRIYPGMAQAINDDELAFTRSMLDAVLASTER
jgi:phospholipase/carboxylesterase